MAWSDTFQQRLKGPRFAPIFLVKNVDVRGYGKAFGAATHKGLDVDAIIIEDSVRTQGSRVTPQSWNSSLGAFSFAVGRPQTVLGQLHKGALLELLLGFDVKDITSFERVALGVVRNITQAAERPEWVVQCDDAMTLMQSRRSTSVNNVQQFQTIGKERTSDENFTVGSEVNLTAGGDVEGFEQSSDHEGAILIDNDWIATYESTSGDTFRGIETGKFGTTASDFSSGTLIRELAYLTGDPISILQRILTSTGTGTNGSFDVYPESWGFSVPIDLLDLTDFGIWKDRLHAVLGFGNIVWDLVVAGPEVSGLTFYLSKLRTAGIFPVVRQGQIVVRMAQPIVLSTTPVLEEKELVKSAKEIVDDDIASVITYEAYDSTIQSEAGSVAIQTGSTGINTVIVGGVTLRFPVSPVASPTEPLGTLPALGQALVDQSGFIHFNENNQAEDTARRLSTWYQRVPERVVLNCTGYRLADLAPGDLVTLTTRRVTGRTEAGQEPMDRRLSMVTAVDPDWYGASTRIQLSIPPDFTGLVR